MIPHASMFREIHALHAAFATSQIDVDEPLDLTAAALEEDDPQMEQARLASRGFRHGHTIRWVAEPDDETKTATVISLTVNELASPTEALLSVADHREMLRAAATSLEIVSANTVSGYTFDEEDVIRIHSSATGPFHITVAVRFLPGTFESAMVEANSIEAIAVHQQALLRQHALLR